jgi:hypothetical protein
MGAGAPQMGPGAPGMRGPDMKAMMGKMGMGAGMAPGAPAGGMPGAAGAGAANVDNGPADFGTARGAVRAFLNALKAKDQDRLNEATALRAQLEATTKNQPIWPSRIPSSMTWPKSSKATRYPASTRARARDGLWSYCEKPGRMVATSRGQ